MFLKRLYLENFLSHEKSEVNFEELLNIALIIGIINNNPASSNGAGKTVIIEGILFAIFEKCRISKNKNATLDKIVRNSGKNGERLLIELEFRLEEDGPLYKIVRKRNNKRNKSECDLYIKQNVKWKSISLDKKAKTNAKIAKLIGIDYDTFIATVCFQQGEIDSFITTRSSGRRKIVNEIIQLSAYIGYKEHCKEKIKGLDESLSSYRFFLEENKNVKANRLVVLEEKKEKGFLIQSQQQRKSLLEKKLSDLRLKQSLETERIIKKESLEKEIDGIQNRSDHSLGELEKARERLEKFEKILFNKRELFQEKQKILKELKEIKLNKEEIKTKMIKLSTNKKEIEKRKIQAIESTGGIKGQITNIKNVLEKGEGNCTTCLTNVDRDHLSHLEQDLKLLDNRLLKAEEKNESIEKELDVVRSQIDDQKEKANKYNYTIKQKNSLKKEMLEIKKDGVTAKESIDDHKELVKQYGKVLLELEDKIKIKKEEIQKIGDIDIKKYKEISQELNQQNLSFESAVKMINNSTLEIGKIESKISNYDGIIEKIDKIEKDQKGLLQERYHFEELSKAFDSKSGIPIYILETVLPELTKITNDILSKLSEGLNIRIETQKTNQDGSVTEAFDIFVFNKGEERLIDLLSNGQKFRVVFSIRVALSLLLARRNGQKIGFLFYDECFANLDDLGINDTIELFRELSKYFKHQLVITHRPDMKDRFESTSLITVEGNGYNWSKITI